MNLVTWSWPRGCRIGQVESLLWASFVCRVRTWQSSSVDLPGVCRWCCLFLPQISVPWIHQKTINKYKSSDASVESMLSPEYWISETLSEVVGGFFYPLPRFYACQHKIRKQFQNWNGFNAWNWNRHEREREREVGKAFFPISEFDSFEGNPHFCSTDWQKSLQSFHLNLII